MGEAVIDGRLAFVTKKFITWTPSDIYASFLFFFSRVLKKLN